MFVLMVDSYDGKVDSYDGKVDSYDGKPPVTTYQQLLVTRYPETNRQQDQ